MPPGVRARDGGTVITDALAALAELPFGWVLLAAGGLALAESGLGVGMLLPGETGVLVLSTTATGTPRFLAMVAVVALGVCAGDHVGYAVGRRYGLRLRDTALVRRVGPAHWDRAMVALHRHGALAVLATRLLPVVRTLTPPAAGAARVAYPRFLAASLAGSFAWAATYVAVGAFAGASVSRLERISGTAGWVALAVVVAVWLGVSCRRRRAPSAAVLPDPTT